MLEVIIPKLAYCHHKIRSDSEFLLKSEGLCWAIKNLDIKRYVTSVPDVACWPDLEPKIFVVKSLRFENFPMKQSQLTLNLRDDLSQMNVLLFL